MSRGGEITALVMAGGRFSQSDAKAAGTVVKAMTAVSGTTLLSRTVAALHKVEAVGRIVVVGPREVQESLDESVKWCDETSTLLGNVQAGVVAADLRGSDRVLLIGSDLADVQAESLGDFIDRSPPIADVTAPLVCRADYERAYPQSGSTFLRLSEGEFTMGSQFLAPAGLLLDPPAGVAAILGHRKSQIKMAWSFGPAFIFGLAIKSLTISRLEKRASEILGVDARAVLNCAPDLAFDVDNSADIFYAKNLLNSRMKD